MARPLQANLSPEEVIVFMSDLFGRFDDLAVRGRVHELRTISSVSLVVPLIKVRHGVHKLKTIGDAYVACAGASSGEAGPPHSRAMS